MDINVRKATAADIDDIEQLYNELNEYLAAGENYPKWKKGIYPLRQDAEEGLADGNLYVAEVDGHVAGTVIFLSEQGDVYGDVKWQTEFNVPVVVLHILAVHPDYMRRGVARQLLLFAETVGRQRGATAIRLDTYIENLPAIKLYESCGFSCRGVVDLGLYEQYGLKWYKVFEKLI